MPFVLRWVVKRLHGKANFVSNFGMHGFHAQKEEEQPVEQEKIVGDDVGEYVDFEEIDKK